MCIKITSKFSCSTQFPFRFGQAGLSVGHFISYAYAGREKPLFVIDKCIKKQSRVVVHHRITSFFAFDNSVGIQKWISVLKGDAVMSLPELAVLSAFQSDTYSYTSPIEWHYDRWLNVGLYRMSIWWPELMTDYWRVQSPTSLYTCRQSQRANYEYISWCGPLIYIIKLISNNESESGCVRVKTIVSLLNQRRYLDIDNNIGDIISRWYSSNINVNQCKSFPWAFDAVVVEKPS